MRNTWRVLLACAAVVALGVGTVAWAQQRTGAETAARTGSPLARLPIRRERLDNGLRLVLSPDPTIPTIAIAVYYDVGSRNEQRGRSGFAHLFEHMMFEGSENVDKGEHFALVMNRGGSLNGTTNHDRTNYFETLPGNELALGLWLEADRMRSLAVTEENFENQRQIVMEEWRQSYGNQPYALSSLRINELAYGDFWPYSHSTIGDMADLQNAPLADVQDFFRSYYPPNNAVLSISGDFDPDQAIELAQRHFGGIASRQVPAYEPAALAPQTSERTDTMLDPLAERPAFHIAWHIPPARERDHYALEMMALILGDGESSRLYQELVKQRELCQEIFVGTDDRRGPDLFSVWAIVAGGHTGAEVRPFIFRQIESVARRGVTARELEKARNRVRSYFVFGLSSNLQRAQRLAEYELYWGNAELIRAELDNYLAVTDADIRRVASQYFAQTNRTVLDVVPPPPEPAAAQPAAEGGAQ
ncbi:MAG: insulinase family protein [Sandaracinaceae bacterium]|nr:insulinase family protein [Sandaracinaceae bacterium]